FWSAAATWVPAGLYATVVTPCVPLAPWVALSARCAVTWRSATFHREVVPPEAPVASRSPAGLNATARTLCPSGAAVSGGPLGAAGGALTCRTGFTGAGFVRDGLGVGVGGLLV